MLPSQYRHRLYNPSINHTAGTSLSATHTHHPAAKQIPQISLSRPISTMNADSRIDASSSVHGVARSPPHPIGSSTFVCQHYLTSEDACAVVGAQKALGRKELRSLKELFFRLGSDNSEWLLKDSNLLQTCIDVYGLKRIGMSRDDRATSLIHR